MQNAEVRSAMQEIVIAGGGFAGLWASLAAVRELECAGAAVRVSLVSADPFLVIRPRLYEPDPVQMRVDLRPTLEPVGVRLITTVVTGVDSVERRLLLADGSLPFDRLVLATGSTLARPAIDGAEHMFDIDSYAGAVRLEQHLRNLGSVRGAAARTVVILGGGFTGIELATELRSRLSTLWGEPQARSARLVLVETAEAIGPALGAGPRPAILAALAADRVEMRVNTRLQSLTQESALFSDGERIPTATVVLTTGMRASPLAATLADAERDDLGRLYVDRLLRVEGVTNVFAAGDIARVFADDAHLALMSCQHALSMGRAAGRNVARDLLGLSLEPYRPPDYVTCLDLGAWGAVFTRGWDRAVQMTGAEAKAVKRQINCVRIYPPRGERENILAAAVQPPPPGQTR
jgi:NADH:ubiquinone reductase (H+-translocating)